ncbi:M20 metallopeptidase family protein [Pseudalkalibacillus berkeleyi]|uniref:M20 family metallopeptidase n=1 Tax=Pseudalkalibacillus berkeleyi TaxID=1069813 RepID=A0ABS9GX84_9BACL|nr:M20 family metallopeptidase [Pseudalkalibacillus berkeleyi]MCF6136188.1 M20 family metallopeptidase [Pseudalkalibacillus berkeleyi]
MKNFYELIDQHFDEMVEIRRYLHQYPELSFEEVQTAAYIAEYYEKLGIPYRANVGGNGIVATIKGSKPGKTVALRADFDALPIHEQSEVPFRSKNDGVMHACGHDGHTATLLVLAKVLNQLKDELEGNIVLIHQHAEELVPGGAISMIEDGCLEGVDYIYGVHLWATDNVGEVYYKEGPFMAAADQFEIKIIGRGGHGAQPHLTKDSIMTASQLVVSLQQIVSRNVDPLESAVLSVGSFVANNAFNVIADTTQLKGTVRTFKESVRSKMQSRMEEVIKGVCDACGTDYEFNYTRGYPPLVNHKEETEHIKQVASRIPGVLSVSEKAAQMGGEDFGYYLQHVPGSFAFVGAKDPNASEVAPHHHPKFMIDERSLPIAAKLLGEATLSHLKYSTENKVESK